MNQNWLELFTPTLIGDIHTILRCNSDNQLKADYIEDLLSPYGFECLGEGTNILCMINPAYKGVVFKVALDEYGIADNFNDEVLMKYIPRYNKVLARDPSAIVSVQVRCVVIKDQARMSMFRPKILTLLRELSKEYIVADLSPDRFLNYGVGRDGKFVIIDGSDLYPLCKLDHEPRCTRYDGENEKTGKMKTCGGKLYYTPDFMNLVCDKCGREYLPIQFRPQKEVKDMKEVLNDGLTKEDITRMDQEEINAIRVRRGEDPIPTGNVRRTIVEIDDSVGVDSRTEAEEAPTIEEPEAVTTEQLAEEKISERFDKSPEASLAAFEMILKSLLDKDEEAVCEIIDKYVDVKSDVLINETTDNDITEEESDADEADDSCLRYHIVKGDDDPETESGIYIDYFGDIDNWEDEYEKNGLSVYLRIHTKDSTTQYQSVSASAMNQVIKACLADSIDDFRNDYEDNDELDDDETDDEDDDE